MTEDVVKEEPLRPTYGRTRPPWVGYWSKRDFSTSRKAWWTELGMTDPLVESGKHVIVQHQLREKHPYYYDPRVPDGTSLAGPMGIDSTIGPNLAIKGDQPMSYNEWSDKVYKTSTQYRDIAAQYELTEGPYPFHKGFKVSPANSRMFDFYSRKNVPWWWPSPFRFFNSPLNEDPHIKGLACAQYLAVAMLPFTTLEMRANDPTMVTPKSLVKRYFKLTTRPALLVFTWGVALSTASMLRHKDDFINHYYASGAVGLVFATMMRDNYLAGIAVALGALAAGLFWQFNRVTEYGLQHKASHRQYGGYWGGPLLWKLKWKGGEIEVPQTVY